MKPRRPHARQRLSRDAERLVWLALNLNASSSRLESIYLEAQINTLIAKMFKTDDEATLSRVFDHLSETESDAHEVLAELTETVCQTIFTAEGAYLLIALPILAWSRYAIPTRNVPKPTLDVLRTQLSAHVLGADTHVHFADYLFSPDQLPIGYADTWKLANALWQAAAEHQDLKIDSKQQVESGQFVSDLRYLMGTVFVPNGHPVFRWNEIDGGRAAALVNWEKQGGPNFQSVLAGCTYRVLTPDAYFAAWRDADQEMWPFTLKAAVAYLQTLFNLPASKIRAVAAPYYEQELEEWRIGFLRAGSPDVVHGVTWPAISDEMSDIGTEIESVLNSTGIGNVLILNTRMPIEYCDDCGAPLFPNLEGESVHAEIPDEILNQAAAQLH